MANYRITTPKHLGTNQRIALGNAGVRVDCYDNRTGEYQCSTAMVPIEGHPGFYVDGSSGLFSHKGVRMIPLVSYRENGRIPDGEAVTSRGISPEAWREAVAKCDELVEKLAALNRQSAEKSGESVYGIFPDVHVPRLIKALRQTV